MVANLPYGVAASVILRTIEQLPRATTWVAMVQKEVGERFAAKPGTSAYGVPSVLAQLAADVKVLRPISRSVFHPVPNVDSVLVRLTRHGPAPEPALRTLVQQGFAHRRKALARSLALSGGDREQARAALEAMGLPADARAETLSPEQWRDLHGKALRVRLVARAPGKVNLSLFVGAPREDGLHPLVSVVQAVSLADELTLEPGGERDEVVCPGVEGENLAARALALFREATGWDAPPQRLSIVKRVPVAGGMGGGSGDAAAALRLAAHAAGGAPPELLHELAVALGADVPSQLSPGRVLMHGAGEHVDPLPDPDPFGLVIVPSPHMLSTPEVYAAFDRLGGARGPAELEQAAAAALAGGPPPPVNDLQDAALSLCPGIDLFPGAMVSGSGPTVFAVFETPEVAREAAHGIPGALAAEPVGADFSRVRAA